MSTELRVDTPVGTFAAIDFGGSGPDVLLVHQVTANAQVWAPLASHLTGFCHPVAIDLRGHGRTEVDCAGCDGLVPDLAHVARALGMRRPLLVSEGSDVISLCSGDLSALDPCGLVMMGSICTNRGLEAQLWFEEQNDLDAVRVWEERFALFASGIAADREDFLDRTVDQACRDWVLAGIARPQWRAYLSRALRDTPDGWERRPNRADYAAFMVAMQERPMGLDLYDHVEVPITFVVTNAQLSSSEMIALERYASGRSQCEVDLVEGGAVASLVDPHGVRRSVRRFLQRLGLVAAM